MSRPASKDALNELHATLATQLANRIKSGEATAADMSVARQFLKDNNIEALALPGSPMEGLRGAITDHLPFAGSETLQ